MKIGEEKIVEVAYRQFRQRGVRPTRLQQIARACGTSLFDLNLVFPTKKDLILAVIKHTLTKKTSFLLVNSSLSASAVTELINFFKFIEETIEELGEDIFAEISRYNPKALDQLREIVDEKLTPYLKKNIERGLNEGFYRDSMNSEVYASTYFFLLRKILERDLPWSETKRVVKHINDMYSRGVLNMKGMRV